MTNPPRKKGTSAETACVRWAHQHGFPHADRQPLRGRLDTADIDLCPGVVVEVKAYRLPTGIPTPGQLTTWLAQAEAERVNAGAKFCPLVVKRPGTTDPGRWFAYLPMRDFALLTGAVVPLELDPEPVMFTLDALARLLRASGWGQEAPTQEAAS